MTSSKYELPVIPCVSGHEPVQSEALFTLVTLGMTASTCAERPRAAIRSRTGILAPSEYLDAETVEQEDHEALVALDERGRLGPRGGTREGDHGAEDGGDESSTEDEVLPVGSIGPCGAVHPGHLSAA